MKMGPGGASTPYEPRRRADKGCSIRILFLGTRREFSHKSGTYASAIGLRWTLTINMPRLAALGGFCCWKGARIFDWVWRWTRSNDIAIWLDGRVCAAGGARRCTRGACAPHERVGAHFNFLVSAQKGCAGRDAQHDRRAVCPTQAKDFRTSSKK